jgi:hypothetical protein
VTLLLLSLFCLLWSAPVEARGRAEIAPGTETASGAAATVEASVPLLYPLGREPEALVRERMDLPASAVALFWSSYRVEDGRVHIDRSGTYHLARLISRKEGGRWAIYSYRVTLAPPERGGRQVEVSFTSEQVDASGLQPAPYAVEEGIRAGGAVSGTARLVDITHLGGRRFRAVVELR